MRSPPPYRDLPKYPVTGGTILLAIAVTLAWHTKIVDITPLLTSGDIRRGEIWRLLTSVFPHVDPMHLIFNLYWTWTFGTLVEKTFGHLRTLGIFVLLGMISSAAEFAFLNGGVGLSGVGYGLFGLLWVLSKRDARFADSVDRKTVQLFVAWFFICIVLTFMGYPVANIAHGAGCCAGALLGWTISSSNTKHRVGIACMVIVTVATLAGATIGRPWINLCKYAGGDLAKYAGYDEAKFGYDALNANKNEEAVRWYRDACRMSPQAADNWYNFGIALERTSHRDQAITAYQHACDLDPDNKDYRSALGSMR